ncbi:hypothetical protein VNO77_30317 [Canavalia gladiata]|uniref:Uncharacterized protein n=1 Tax=Canavalia gladiata TaxID=3824 RepID=A0AAN9KQ63_CANGL
MFISILHGAYFHCCSLVSNGKYCILTCFHLSNVNYPSYPINLLFAIDKCLWLVTGVTRILSCVLRLDLCFQLCIWLQIWMMMLVLDFISTQQHVAEAGWLYHSQLILNWLMRVCQVHSNIQP